MTTTADEQFNTLVRGCEGVYTPEELRERIRQGRPMRVKLGMDPTAPDLTLGHTVVLRKLRQFQDFGHKAVLIIGDYTAMIGDPTGRSKTRPMLTPEEIDANAQTYLQQAGKVLDLSPEKLEVRRNSEWLQRMSCADVVKLLSCMTVARMLERDVFEKRRAEGREIFLHELLYPLMQARDSVEIAADVELGGTDQTFNNLCGRDLQRTAGQRPQIVMVVPLLIGTDGREKMSKSLGNYVAVTDPPSEMFGKIMSIPDPLMRPYFELLTDLPESQIAEWTDPEKCHPRDTKEKLAKLIVTQYHSAQAAESAAEEFRRVFGAGRRIVKVVTEGVVRQEGVGRKPEQKGADIAGLPDEIPETTVPASMMQDGKVAPLDLITHCGFESSRTLARKLIAERGVRLNGVVIDDPFQPVAVQTGDILQRGKRRFVRLRIENS